MSAICKLIILTILLLLPPSPGVKQPGHAFYHSPLSSAEVKNEWDYTFSYTHDFMACRGKNFVLHYCCVMLHTVSDL